MTLQLFWRSLHQRRDWRGSPARRAGAAIKYALRSARHARLHAAWLDFIYRTPLLAAMLVHDPRLLERPQHPYINRCMSRA